MIKPDVIVSQPDNVDFPPWRAQMAKWRDSFGQILVCIYRTNYRLNLSRFFEAELPKIGAEVLRSPPLVHSVDDWRNIAVRLCLPKVTSDRILFLEQDFIFNNERFLPTALESSHKLLGFKERGDRLGRFHPAFLLVDTKLVKKTSCNFGILPEVLDHFGIFSRELEEQIVGSYLEDLGLNEFQDWEHLRGLTSNYSIVMNGGQPNHNPERFRDYNRAALACTVSQSAEFLPYIVKAAEIEVQR